MKILINNCIIIEWIDEKRIDIALNWLKKMIKIFSNGWAIERWINK